MTTTDPTASQMIAALMAEEEREGGSPDEAAMQCADALGEAGEHGRAELMRIQTRLRSSGDYNPKCDTEEGRHYVQVGHDPRVQVRACVRCWDAERAREAELRVANEADWRRAGACPGCDGKGYHTADVRDTERARCSRCFGTGDAGGLLQVSALKTAIVAKFNGGRAKPEYRHPIRWVRGLPYAVEVPRLSDVLSNVPCPVCDHPRVDVACGIGDCVQGVVLRPTPWAAAVARHHPTVRAFVVGDRQPWRVGARGNRPQRYTFGQDNGPDCEYISGPESRLPPALYAEYQKLEGHFWRYETPAAAIDALARAVMRVIRAQLGSG